MLVTRELGLGGSERQLAETALALSRDGDLIELLQDKTGYT